MPGYMVKNYGGNKESIHPGNPVHTVTAQDHHGLVQQPFIVELNRTGKAKGTSERLSTVMTSGSHHAIAQAPIIVENKGKSNAAPSSKSLSTQTTMINHGILSNESVNAFLSYYYGTSQASGIHEATGTVTTNDRLSLVLSPSKVQSIEDYTYRMLKAHEIIASYGILQELRSTWKFKRKSTSGGKRP